MNGRDLEIGTTVFIDLVDSTILGKTHGAKYIRFHEEYLRVGETLARKCQAEMEPSGAYKNLGDGHMAVFRGIKSALSFAVKMQQYIANRPKTEPFEISITAGIATGTMFQKDRDAFGDGVNKAARTASRAQAGQILLEESFIEHLTSVLDSDQQKYFGQDIEIPDVKSYGKLTFKTFDWKRYLSEDGEGGLAKLILGHMEAAGVTPTNLSPANFGSGGLVIWPVAPRNVVTGIHKGQVEIVRLLHLLGCRVHVLITDCKNADSHSPEYPIRFKSLLRDYLSTRGIELSSQDDFSLMSNLYEPSSSGYKELQETFKRVSRHLTLDNLIQITEKEYGEEIKQLVAGQSTLNLINPLLTFSAALHIANYDASRNSVVIAGQDEQRLWNYVFNVPGERFGNELLGFCFNPIYYASKQGDRPIQFQQKLDWPTWRSQNELIEQMSLPGSNLAWWSFCMHAFLNSFPSDSIHINGVEVSPKSWTEDKVGIPASLSASSLASITWPLLEPIKHVNGRSQIGIQPEVPAPNP